jgi:hypothetical protein
LTPIQQSEVLRHILGNAIEGADQGEYDSYFEDNSKLSEEENDNLLGAFREEVRQLIRGIISSVSYP